MYYQIRRKLGIITQWVWVRDPKLETTPREIYQLKITLMDIRPPIWRRIQVPDCTLRALHEIIQAVMGWKHSHMHQFIINNEYYGAVFHDEMDTELKMKDENGIRLSQIIEGVKNKFRFVYEYDFGDSWQHEILFEKSFEAEPKGQYPRCLEGERACPPEDVSVASGVTLDFLEVMADPENEEHRSKKEWIGGKFDPEKFSVNAVNKELRMLSLRLTRRSVNREEQGAPGEPFAGAVPETTTSLPPRTTSPSGLRGIYVSVGSAPLVRAIVARSLS